VFAVFVVGDFCSLPPVTTTTEPPTEPTNDAGTIGLVGLGIIGSKIAEHIAGVGYRIAVFDIRGEALQEATAAGAHPAGSPAEVAAVTDTVLVCVQNDAQCEAVLTGPDGILESARPGLAVAILSTVHPHTITRLAAAAGERGVTLVDAPMVGQGREHIPQGLLWVVVGGTDVEFARVAPVLRTFAGRALHTGPLGSGAVLKLAHNVMVYGGYLATIEALELARVAGVADGLVQEITEHTGTLSPQSAILAEIYERRRARRGDAFEEHHMRIAAEVLEKDLRIATEVAAEHGLHLPGAAVLDGRGHEVYRARPAEGG
jgi:3-hydroxyisobutyrate dehydrogenase-like beta-hydroxyacid dehydrogenase